IDVTVAATATDAAGNVMSEINFQDVFDIEIASSIAYAMAQGEFVAYPNPLNAGSDLRLIMPSTIQAARVVIFDGQGKLISDTNYSAGQSPLLISTANWAEGMYLVRVLSNESEGHLKITILD
ncbi:MAG: T9SS type A sorting domain-containing protein, partial [Flavobacteriales bacterium]